MADNLAGTFNFRIKLNQSGGGVVSRRCERAMLYER